MTANFNCVFCGKDVDDGMAVDGAWAHYSCAAEARKAGIQHLVAENERLTAKLAQVERERDETVEFLGVVNELKANLQRANERHDAANAALRARVEELENALKETRRCFERAKDHGLYSSLDASHDWKLIECVDRILIAIPTLDRPFLLPDPNAKSALATPPVAQSGDTKSDAPRVAALGTDAVQHEPPSVSSPCPEAFDANSWPAHCHDPNSCSRSMTCNYHDCRHGIMPPMVLKNQILRAIAAKTGELSDADGDAA